MDHPSGEQLPRILLTPMGIGRWMDQWIFEKFLGASQNFHVWSEFGQRIGLQTFYYNSCSEMMKKIMSKNFLNIRKIYIMILKYLQIKILINVNR